MNRRWKMRLKIPHFGDTQIAKNLAEWTYFDAAFMDRQALSQRPSQDQAYTTAPLDITDFTTMSKNMGQIGKTTRPV